MTFQNSTYHHAYDRTTRWPDGANLILAAWLFISPWVLQFAYTGAANGSVAAWDAWVLGVVVFVVSLSAMGQRFVKGQEWLNLVLGIWIFIAPWVLTFAGSNSTPAWDHWIVGALIFLVSAGGVSTARTLPATADMPRR
jgi:hypothetical protein